MKNVYVLIVAILFLFIPIVAAVETTITVETLPAHNVNIFVLDGKQAYYLLQSFLNQPSGGEGEVTVTANVEASSIDVLVVVKKNGNKLFNKRFEDFATGGKVELELPERDDDCEQDSFDFCETEEQCTAVNGSWYNDTCNTIPQEPERATGGTSFEDTENISLDANGTDAVGNTTVLTGFSLFGKLRNTVISGKMIAWTLGVTVILIIAVILSIRMIALHRMTPHPKGSVMQQMQHNVGLEREIENAERKIREAQEEIGRIKRRAKMEEVMQRLKRDKEELERLRKGSVQG